MAKPTNKKKLKGFSAKAQVDEIQPLARSLTETVLAVVLGCVGVVQYVFTLKLNIILPERADDVPVRPKLTYVSRTTQNSYNLNMKPTG